LKESGLLCHNRYKLTMGVPQANPRMSRPIRPSSDQSIIDQLVENVSNSFKSTSYKKRRAYWTRWTAIAVGVDVAPYMRNSWSLCSSVLLILRTGSVFLSGMLYNIAKDLRVKFSFTSIQYFDALAR